MRGVEGASFGAAPPYPSPLNASSSSLHPLSSGIHRNVGSKLVLRELCRNGLAKIAVVGNLMVLFDPRRSA